MSTSVKQSDFAHETRAAFAVFDKDNSGTISADELRQVMKSLGEELTDREIDEMIAEADKDRNGSIDCKSYPFFQLSPTAFFCAVLRFCANEAPAITSSPPPQTRRNPPLTQRPRLENPVDEEFVQLLSPKP